MLNRTRDKARYAANPEIFIARAKEQYLTHHERDLIVHKKWRERNFETISAKIKEWRAANPERVRGYVLKRKARGKACIEALEKLGIELPASARLRTEVAIRVVKQLLSTTI
jgi:hypothetical protein